MTTSPSDQPRSGQLGAAACPFCGCERSFSSPVYDGLGAHGAADVWIECGKCGANGPLSSDEVGAWARWNARAITHEVTMLKAALLNAARELDAIPREEAMQVLVLKGKPE